MAVPDSDWQDALRALMPEGESPAEAASATADEQPKQSRRVDILLDKKGRNGKTATLVVGFDIGDDAVADIARRLKSRLGCGGSSRGGEILIQGDRRADVARLLTAEGIKNRII